MSNDFHNQINEAVYNYLVNNPKIFIEVEEWLLNILLGNNIKKTKLNNWYKNSLYPIFNSIKKNSVISYDTNNKIELETYFIEYLNVINKCLLAFNSFLLQVVYDYCLAKNINYYNDGRPLNEIFNPSSNKNSVEELFKFLIKEKICYPNQFYIYVLYESLFRNQFCHGWHNFFYHLLDNNNQSDPNWKYPTSNSKTGFLFDDTNNNLYTLRKNLKHQSILHKKNLNLKDYITISSILDDKILEIKFNILLPHRKDYWINLESFEPGSSLLKMYDLNGELSKDSEGNYYIIDLMLDAEKKENKNEFMNFSLSLNDLVKNIKITIKDLLDNKFIS